MGLREQLRKNSMLLYQKTISKFTCFGPVRELVAIQSKVIMDHPFQFSLLFQVTYLNDGYFMNFV